MHQYFLPLKNAPASGNCSGCHPFCFLFFVFTCWGVLQRKDSPQNTLTQLKMRGFFQSHSFIVSLVCSALYIPLILNFGVGEFLKCRLSPVFPHIGKAAYKNNVATTVCAILSRMLSGEVLSMCTDMVMHGGGGT